jgi:mannose-1-phosphate guanylyltransferase
MKAVILVGGLGTRLRPLTCNTPKPMLPLMGTPFIEWMLTNLRDQGIDEAILAVQYLADRFRDSLGDGSRLGMKVHIIEEPEPRGTAGAVKYVAHLLDDTTFIFNGDVMTDLDLRAMLAYHRQRQSELTIALTPVEDPTAFGLVETTDAGRITRFLEKPRPEEVTTNMINAGTYIMEPHLLDYIPTGQHYMFERGLFPTALQNNHPMYGFASDAYWTDIGKPQTYLDVHHDILNGKVRFALPGTHAQDSLWQGQQVSIADSAQIHGTVVLGDGVVIGENVTIVGPTIIGAHSVIGAGSQITASVLWQHNQIGTECTIDRAVLGHRNQVHNNTKILHGVIVSDDTHIGAHNHLDHGLRLWPNTTLPDTAISFS